MEEETANSKVDQDPEQVGENEMGDLKETKNGTEDKDKEGSANYDTNRNPNEMKEGGEEKQDEKEPASVPPEFKDLSPEELEEKRQELEALKEAEKTHF